jgi:HSP20 family protein
MTTLVLPSRLQSLISQLAQRIADSPMFAHICWLRARTFMRLEDEMTDDGYQVRAELPGIDPGSDVDVTTRDGRLTITADRSQKVDFSGRSEFGYGSFARSVPLPDGADPDSITTTYDNGILTVSVPLSGTAAAANEDTAVHAID